MGYMKWAFPAAVVFFAETHAQQTAFFSDRQTNRIDLAENLYDSKILAGSQYQYAEQYFYNDYLSETKKEAARFFVNIIDVVLGRNHAERGLEDFMKEYPNSAYFAKADMPLADYWLAKKDFAKALESLQKVNANKLSKEENADYVLKVGYAKYMLGDTKGALEALEEAYLHAAPSEKNNIAFMLGHLYYTEGDTASAFKYFDTLKEDQKFARQIRPYYVQMYFNGKDYDRAIGEGQQLLADGGSQSFTAEVKKIIGESYFMKGNDAAAYPYLKDYLGSVENPSDSDLYEMGYVSSKLKRYDEAVSYYNRLVNSSSAQSQNAYYQLGNAYLQTGKKQEALSAYRSAYQMNYDANVKQKAHLQYAKLSYELGNPFEAPAEVMQAFIKNYQNSADRAEIQSLLVKSYLYSGDYRATLAAIDKMQNPSAEILKTDQEVSFLLGSEEFNKSDFDEAEKYFLRSLRVKNDTETANRASYWLAQTDYQKGNYAAAIFRFQSLLTVRFRERPQLEYDLGYAFFKSKNYAEAQKYFSDYLKNPSPDFKNDAQLRLADTYYAENNLADAVAFYEKSDDATGYAAYQKAMALGAKGDTQAEILALKNLLAKFPKSEYADDAKFQMAAAYAAQDDFANSDALFSEVVKTSADRDLVINSKIYLIQNKIGENRTESALADLQTLANTYRNTAYAAKIAQVARAAYAKTGDAAAYQNFAKSIGVDATSGELAEISLAAAKNNFQKKDYRAAIAGYDKFLSQNGAQDADYQVRYELAESYYQTKDYKNAARVFQDVADAQNDYRDDAAARLAQIFLTQNRKADAKKYLEQAAKSSDASVKNFANTELMKVYADERDFKNAEISADAVLLYAKNSAAVMDAAKAVKARKLMDEGRDKNAQAAYAALEKSANSAVAAESLYAKAFYQNKAKAFKSSNETIFRLANNYATEQYWGAKSLLVMAKNYIGLKDKYQATYTLDQIISNYYDFPEIVSDAKEIKKSIK